MNAHFNSSFRADDKSRHRDAPAPISASRAPISSSPLYPRVGAGGLSMLRGFRRYGRGSGRFGESSPGLNISLYLYTARAGSVEKFGPIESGRFEVERKRIIYRSSNRRRCLRSSTCD